MPSGKETLMTAVKGPFDLIIDTVPYVHDRKPYLPTLAIDGTLVLVGYLDDLNPMLPFGCCRGNAAIGVRLYRAGRQVSSQPAVGSGRSARLLRTPVLQSPRLGSHAPG